MKHVGISIGVLLIILYSFTFLWLFNEWLTNPYYSHGLLIPIISGFFIYKKRDVFKNDQSSLSCRPGLYVFMLGILVYMMGFIQSFPFLTAISMLLTISGLILYFYGKSAMHDLFFPISYLIFAIPLPFIMLEQIAYLLQLTAIRSSSFLLGLGGLPVSTIGSEIHIGDLSFYIGLPCSGINSLISLLALTTVFIYILRCCLHKKITLLIITAPIAVIANIIRVTLIILIANSYGIDVAIDFFHDFSSPLLFIVAFIMLVLISRLLKCKISIS